MHKLELIFDFSTRFDPDIFFTYHWYYYWSDKINVSTLKNIISLIERFAYNSLQKYKSLPEEFV
jgi:hypothetical protein